MHLCKTCKYYCQIDGLDTCLITLPKWAKVDQLYRFKLPEEEDCFAWIACFNSTEQKLRDELEELQRIAILHNREIEDFRRNIY